MKIEWKDAKDPGGYGTSEFIAQNDHERPVTGCLWTPFGTVRQNTLMAFGHGASGDRYQMPIPHLARRLAKQGIASVSMDGPVHGLRQKGPGGRDALGEEMRRSEMVDDMVQDWHDTIKIAETKLGFEATRFAYFGLSMGSIFGIPFLASRSRKKQPIVAATLGLLGTTGAVSRLADRLIEDASEIRPPLFFVMQLEDELFPRDGYLKLFDAFSSSDKRIHANPGLHPAVPAEEIDYCFQFLHDRLVEDEVRQITSSAS